MRRLMALLLLASFPWIPSFGQNNPSPAQPAAPPVGASAPAASEPPINRPVRDKWALVVGIGKYANGKVPKLKYAAKDARDFRNFLVNEANFAPDHVRLLVDEDATQRRVISELGNKFLARVTKPDDVVVLFFSSHGSPAQLDIKGKNFLVAHDSDPDDLYATGINMDNILEMARDRIDSQRVLLVLDACHSGVIGSGEKGMLRPANFDAEQFAQGSGKLIICSSNPEESSWESKRYENGIFTRKLLEGLRMNGKRTTLGEAFPFIQKAVAAEAQEDYAARQSPVVRSKWSGNELVLAAPAAAPQGIPVAVKQELQPDSTVPRATTPVASTTSVKRNLAYEKGVQLFTAKKYEEAIGSLSAALKQPNADKWDIYLYLGNAHSKLGNRFEASKYWKLCIKEKPGSLAAQNAELQMKMAGGAQTSAGSYSAAYPATGNYSNASRYAVNYNNSQTAGGYQRGAAGGSQETAAFTGGRLPASVVSRIPAVLTMRPPGTVSSVEDYDLRITEAENNFRAADARLMQVKNLLQPYFNTCPDECRKYAQPFEDQKNFWSNTRQTLLGQQQQALQALRSGGTFAPGGFTSGYGTNSGTQQNCQTNYSYGTGGAQQCQQRRNK